MGERQPARRLLGEDVPVRPPPGRLAGGPTVPVVALVVALVVAALVLTGCQADGPEAGPPQTGRSSAAPSPSQQPSPAPPAPRPRVGTCHGLAFEDAVAPTARDRGIACRRVHTTQTYFVGTLDRVVDGHLLAVDSEHVQRQVAAACPRRLPAWLGGTPDQLRLSVFRPVWFSPTVEEGDAGADWFRCDVLGLAGDEQLVRTRGSLEGALASADRRREFGICGTTRPGTPSFARVACSSRHAWRAVASYDAGRGRYPGSRALQDRGAGVCKDQVSAQADDPLDFEWGYDYPTREQWLDGQQHGLCWAPD